MAKNKEWEKERKEFKKDSKKVKKFIEKWFGPRCDDIEETCICCQRWHYYDHLTENPFNE